MEYYPRIKESNNCDINLKIIMLHERCNINIYTVGSHILNSRKMIMTESR